MRHAGRPRGALEVALATVDGAVAALELQQALFGHVAGLLVLFAVCLLLALRSHEQCVRGGAAVVMVVVGAGDQNA
jgi:hypothetical protein